MIVIAVGVSESLVRAFESAACAVKMFHEPGKIKPEYLLLDSKNKIVLLDADASSGNMQYPASLREYGFLGPVIGISSRPRDSDKYDDVECEVVFMRAGGDRLLRTPYSVNVIKAVAETLMRRAYSVAAKTRSGDATATEKKILVFRDGKYVLNRTMWTARIHGTVVQLTKTEFDLLWHLGERPGRVFSRNELLDVTSADQQYLGDRTIDSHIKRIRQKVKALGHPDSVIQTVYGVGYRVPVD